MPTNYERVQAILAERDAHAAMTRKTVELDLLTANGAAERMAELDAKFGWSTKLAALRAEADADLAKAETAVTAVIAQATTPSNGDPLLTEMQIGRAWNRMKLGIDQETPAGKLVAVSRALASTTDPIERAALLQEGPAYLAAHGHRNPTEKLYAVLSDSIPELAAAEATLHHTGMVHRITADNTAYVERQLHTADERTGPRHDLALTDPDKAAPLPAVTA